MCDGKSIHKRQESKKGGVSLLSEKVLVYLQRCYMGQVN